LTAEECKGIVQSLANNQPSTLSSFEQQSLIIDQLMRVQSAMKTNTVFAALQTAQNVANLVKIASLYKTSEIISINASTVSLICLDLCISLSKIGSLKIWGKINQDQMDVILTGLL
jgi:hypothetical protein